MIEKNKNYYIIADHLRTIIFALADGADIKSKGRGYVLKKLVKRVALSAYFLGLNTRELKEISKELIKVNSTYHTHLKNGEELIVNKLKREIDKSMEFVNKSFKNLNDYYSPEIRVEDIFFLYDTKGIPLELIRFLFKEKNHEFPEQQFFDLLDKQKKQSSEERKAKKILAFNNKNIKVFKK